LGLEQGELMSNPRYTHAEVQRILEEIRSLKARIGEADPNDSIMKREIARWKQEIDGLEYSLSGNN
jgi:hypothetical protein